VAIGRHQPPDFICGGIVSFGTPFVVRLPKTVPWLIALPRPCFPALAGSDLPASSR
jgi:hypothetical protein